MTRVQVRVLLVISLEYDGASWSEVWIDKVVLLGRIIVHVVHPSLPAGSDLFALGREPMGVV